MNAERHLDCVNLKFHLIEAFPADEAVYRMTIFRFVIVAQSHHRFTVAKNDSSWYSSKHLVS